MIKHNARWYDNRIATKTQALEQVRATIKAMEEDENTDWDKVGNAFYDKEYDLQEEIRDLERQRNTRNWTGADWASWELVMNNID